MSSTPRPRAPRRRGLRSAIATVTVLCVLLGGVVFVLRPLDATPSGAAIGYLGGEGHREVSSIDETTVIRETAHNTGAELLNSGPTSLAYIDEALDKLGSPFVRILETRIHDGQVSRSTHVFELTEQGVLRAATAAGTTTLYWPPVVELPADVDDGSTWSSEGTAVHVLSWGTPVPEEFSMEGSAALATEPALRDEGCLVVSTNFTFEESSSESETTWCPGRGIVDGVPTALPGLGPDAGLASEVVLDPASWEERPVDPFLDATLRWDTQLPAAGTDQMLILAHQTSGDIIFAPGYSVPAAFRAHPGGNIATLTRFGDLVVATTTQARVIGYDLNGVAAWDVVMPDLVTVPPVPLGGQLVVVDTAGNLAAIDPLTGEEHWRHALRTQPSGELIECGQAIVVPTTSAELVAFDGDGSRQWSVATSDNPTLATCATGSVVAFSGDRLEVVNEQGVRTVSMITSDSALRELFVQGEHLVTVSSTAVTRYHPTSLRFISRHEESLGAAALGGGYLIGLSPQRLVVWDERGEEIAEWETAIAPANLNAHLSILDTGVFAFAGDLSTLRLL